MPRRPPARVRAQQRRRLPYGLTRRFHRVPGASGALQSAIVRLENTDTRFSAGEIAASFLEWQRWIHRPVRQLSTACGSCPCPTCGTWSREVLERAVHRLPKRQSRELHHLLAPLDEHFISRTVPVPSRSARRWWACRA